MDLLGRYYTSDVISNLLVSNLITSHPEKILDLGLGDASLTKAAYLRWAFAKYYATEIEENKAIAIEEKLSFVKVFAYDTLHPKTSEKLKIKFGEIDIAICNPPYVKVDDKTKYIKLFEKIGCSEFNKLKRITSEIVFFAHNVKLLKSDGELGIIVSDSLISGQEFRLFRETLMNKFDVRRIIQLPDNVFHKTEARTHIIFISKSKSTKRTCELLMSSSTGELSRPIELSYSDLVFRMDYQYHNSKAEILSNKKTLNDIGATIKRGKYSGKELRQLNINYFHSTSFKDYPFFIEFEDDGRHNESKAKEGDILLCRVGKRVLGKMAVISKGNVVFSDCIFRITVPKSYKDKVIESFISEEGQKWLNIYAHGVCSQVISKSDLLNFPIFKL